jgi:hypothetical protein
MYNMKKMELQVTDGVQVYISPDAAHEFLMTTKEVANGYGTSEYAVRKTLLRHSQELIEGKHFVTAGTFCPRDHQTVLNLPYSKHSVRLIFFLNSIVSTFA